MPYGPNTYGGKRGRPPERKRRKRKDLGEAMTAQDLENVRDEEPWKGIRVGPRKPRTPAEKVAAAAARVARKKAGKARKAAARAAAARAKRKRQAEDRARARGREPRPKYFSPHGGLLIHLRPREDSSTQRRYGMGVEFLKEKLLDEGSAMVPMGTIEAARDVLTGPVREYRLKRIARQQSEALVAGNKKKAQELMYEYDKVEGGGTKEQNASTIHRRELGVEVLREKLNPAAIVDLIRQKLKARRRDLSPEARKRALEAARGEGVEQAKKVLRSRR